MFLKVIIHGLEFYHMMVCEFGVLINAEIHRMNMWYKELSWYWDDSPFHENLYKVVENQKKSEPFVLKCLVYYRVEPHSKMDRMYQR